MGLFSPIQPFSSYFSLINKQVLIFTRSTFHQQLETEKDLIARCLQNDPIAQRELYDRYAARMYGICRRFAGHNLEARDIFQEGFVRVFVKLNQFRFQGPLEAWLRKIFINTAITLAKKELKVSGREPLKADLQVESDALNGLEKLSMEEVLQLIHGLPAGYRTVFNLFVIEGYSHKEIGKKLGISENTSKSQLFGAKRCLRLKLTEYRNSNGRK